MLSYGLSCPLSCGPPTLSKPPILQEWAAHLARHNSGTYNNQYMVVDLARFKAGQVLMPGLLVVVEQIPGLVESADETDILAGGHWASYNVPFFPRVSRRCTCRRGPCRVSIPSGTSSPLASPPATQIYNLSGYPDMVSKADAHGQHFSKVGGGW